MIIQKFTEKQLKIYDGLRNIGEEIASFYKDAVQISLDKNLKTKSYLLAHCAREIDGGIRDVLTGETRESKNKAKKDANKKGLKGHQYSIIVALGVDEDSNFANEWYEIATQFAGFAHRHGPFREPREFGEFFNLWERYEIILGELFGNYYAVDQRIGRILKHEEPTEVILETLRNVFKNQHRKIHFYSKLSSSKWLKPLMEKGFFHPSTIPQEIPHPSQEGYFKIPYWAPIKYLQNISAKNFENPDDEISLNLLIIVEEYILYESKNGSRIKNRNLDYFILEVLFNIPIHNLSASCDKSQYVSFIKNVLKEDSFLLSSLLMDTFLQRIIKGKDKSLLLLFLKIILNPIKLENSIYQYTTLINESYFERNLKKITKEIQAIGGLDVFNLIKQYLDIIVENNNVDMTSFDLPSVSFKIEDDKYVAHEKLHRVLTKLLTSNLEEANELSFEILNPLINSEKKVYKRIGIFILNEKFQLLRDSLLKINYNPFIDFSFESEWINLIKQQSIRFNEIEINKIIEWIKEFELFVVRERKNDFSFDEKILINRVHDFYKILEPSNNQNILELIEEYSKKDIIGLPNDLSELEIIKSSEITEDDLNIRFAENILSKTPGEFKRYLVEYDKVNYYGEIDIAQAGYELTQYIETNVELFFQNIDLFKNISSHYSHFVLQAVSHIWKNDNFQYWKEFLEFINSEVDDEKFSINTSQGFALNFGRLILKVLQKEERILETLLMEDLKNIIFKLLTQYPPEIKSSSDLFFEALNRSHSILIETLVYCSLYIGKYNEGNELDKWDIDIKAKFDFLLTNSPSVELHYHLGISFGIFQYLDKDWYSRNWDKIFPIEEELWLSTFKSYIQYSRVFYNDTYLLLKSKGEVKRAIENNDFMVSEVGRKFIFFISMAYALRLEKFGEKNNILDVFLRKENPLYFKIFINQVSLYNNIIQKKELKEIWRKILKKTKRNLQKKEFKEVVGIFSYWIKFIDLSDDEIFGWLKISADNLINTRYRREFYESLFKQIEKNPDKVGKLVLISANNLEYLYGVGELNKIVEFLFENDRKEIANKICHEFGKNGFNGLADMFGKYNKLS